GAVTGSSQTVSPTSTLTYTLTATNTTGSSTATATVTVTPVTPDTTAPSVPTGLTASAITTTGLTLTWTAATDNVAVTGYRVSRATATAPIATVTTGTSFTDTGLTANTPYTYTLAAFDAAGNASAKSSPVTATTSAVATTPVISAFTASPTTITAGGSSTLAWTVTGATSLSLNGTLVTGTSTVVSPTATTTYTLTATNTAGPVTRQVTVTISGSTDTEKPTVPANLSIKDVTGTTLTLSWDASTDNVGVTGYRVYRDGALLRTVTSGLSLNDTILTANTTYSYTVAATDAARNSSAQSAAKTVTTTAGAGTPPVIQVAVHPGTTVEVGEEVMFDASDTTDDQTLQTKNCTFEWTFGDIVDEQVANRRSGRAIVHFFMAPGVYPVKLKVIDSDGNLVTKTTQVTVTGVAPIAGFELRHAPFHCRLAQFVYAQVPASVTAVATNRLRAVVKVSGSPDKVLADQTNLKTEEVFLLDHQTLPLGNHALEVELLNAQGTRISFLREKFTKSVATPTIAIDQFNNIYRNGKSTYTVAGWGISRAIMPDWNSMGVANQSFMENFGQSDTYYTADTWMTYLDALESYGWSAIGADRYPSRFNEISNRQNRNATTVSYYEYVNRAKNHPAMFGWCFDDEPNIGGLPAHWPVNVMAAQGHIVNQLDPNHVNVANLAGYECFPSAWWGDEFYYLYSEKVFGKKHTYYDIQHGAAFTLERPMKETYQDPEHPERGIIDNWVRFYLKGRQEHGYGLLPNFGVVATTILNVGNPENIEPTPGQSRMLAWLQVVSGLKGMNWYQYQGQTRPEMFGMMAEFKERAEALTPVLFQTDANQPTVTTSATTAGNRVETFIRKHEGKVYLVAVRLTEPDITIVPVAEPASITANFTVQGHGLTSPVARDYIPPAFDNPKMWASPITARSTILSRSRELPWCPARS
ncbi:MAG: fibronectin type III domain-containing protein, partial [Holophaga sp.]|nr:fibronectin type III domain-containing protein [Holophaga sp.]